MAEILFLHGLESAVDADRVPTGSKARHLREAHGATLVPLDTRMAVARKQQLGAAPFVYPYEGYAQVFETPLARARAAMATDTRLIIGSSFGGAVLLRLLHEEPSYQGAALFLAGAGVKLTPYRVLPRAHRCLLIHGRADEVVPWGDSQLLADTSPNATLRLVDDDHYLGGLVPEGLSAAVAELMRH